MSNYLGIDWGGTYIKAGIVSARGQILASTVFNSQQLKEKTVFIEKVRDLLAFYRKYKPCGVGIGVPGIINVKQGFIYYLPNISGWKNYPLKQILEKKLKLPIAVENDANLFGLAEARLGAARGFKNALCFTLGTGLGSAVIIDGKLLKSRTSACELAHVPLSLDGMACGCGGRGCIETFVGNRYLLAKYHKLSKNNSLDSVKAIYQLAMKKDRLALKVWQDFSLALGSFLGGMVNIFNPEVIVFGGGVSKAFKIFGPMVKRAIQKQAMPPNFLGLKLKTAKLKNPGLVGAALLVKEKSA